MVAIHIARARQGAVVFFGSPDECIRRAADLMVILLASHPAGSGFGIRVVAHVRKLSQNTIRNPHLGNVGFPSVGIFRPLPLPDPRAASASGKRHFNLKLKLIEFPDRGSVQEVVASTLGLERSSIAIKAYGFRRPAEGIRQYVLNCLPPVGRKRPCHRACLRRPGALLFFGFCHRTDAEQRWALSSSPLALVSKTALVADARPSADFSDRSSIAGEGAQIFANDGRHDPKRVLD